MFVPLQDEDLLTFIDNQDDVYDIEFAKNTLDNHTAFIYLSNLEIKFKVNFDGLSKQQKFDILNEYLKFDAILNCENLEKLALKAFNRFKGIDIQDDNRDCVLSDEELDEFIEQNKDLLTRYDEVFSSLFFFILYSFYNEKERDELKANCSKIVTDSRYVGINFVNLLKYKEFYAQYLLFAPKYTYYFEPYFDEYMFKGENLYKFINTENNIVLRVFSDLFNATAEGESKDVPSV